MMISENDFRKTFSVKYTGVQAGHGEAYALRYNLRNAHRFQNG